MAERKTRMPGFIGPSHTGRSQRFDCQRTVNLYLELSSLGGGKGQEPACLISTPGLDLVQSVGTGPIRALYTLSNSQVAIVVSGNEVYRLSSAAAIPVRYNGNLTTETGPVSIADNGTSVVLVDGSNGYHFTIGDLTLNTITDQNFYPADIVTFQDGYFICNQKGTNYFFVSDLYDVTWPPLNLAGKSGSSDILVAAYSNNRQLYLLGTNTTEIWFNSGASANTPFSRQDGRFSQVGCASAASIARCGETFFWLGTNAQGGGVVYTLNGAEPQRISTNAVEYAIQKHSDLAGARGYGYQQEGHLFYILNIPGANTTLCYDVDTKQWSERQSTVNGNVGRHLGECHCVLNNQHIIGDHRNGNLYRYDLDVYTDNGESRYKMRQSPHVSEVLNDISFKLFEIDCQFGVGLVDDGVNPQSDVAPHLALELSRDGGLTWSNAMIAPMGKQGRFLTRARWQRLGKGRDVVFRVSCTDNVAVTLLSAHLDLDVNNA